MRGRSYVLKITLNDTNPPVWRRFVVPASITLDRLHDVIQIVMGWQDSHLHEFNITGTRYAEVFESEDEVQAEVDGNYRLGDLIKRKGITFEYLYDFGDSWMHHLILENTNHTLGDEPVECLDGERSCPPEDVGGVHRYYEFCKAIADSNEPEHDAMMEWYGKPYDSERFNRDEVNLELIKYLRWTRDRPLP